MNCTINNVNLSFDEGNRLRETINRVSKSDANKATILAGFLTNIDFRKFLLENITNEDIIKGESISFDLFTNKDYLKLNQNKLGFLLNEFYKDTYLSVDNSKTIRGMGRLNGFTSITAKKIAKDYTAVLLLKEYRQELNKNSKTRRKPLEIIKVVNDKIESTFYKRMNDFILYIINDENSSKEAKEMAQKYIDFIDKIETIKQQYNDNDLLLNSNKTQKEEFEQQIININQQIKEAKQNKDANTFKRLVKEVTEIKNAIKEIDKVLNEINIQQKRHSENVYTIYRDRYALAYNIVTLYHNNYDAPQAVKLRNYMNLFIQSKLNADDWYFQVFNTKNMTSIIKAFNTVEDIEKYLEQEDENSDNVINKYNQYNIDETTKSWEDALYKNFNQTINNKLRIILSTIPKLANKYNNLNEVQSTDTENELGVETYMDAQYLTVQIYSFGDFSNVNSLIKSLDKKSQEIKAIYGLGTIVQMMKNNKDFANFVFVNFAKPIANKTILTISEMSKEDGIKFDYSNPDSFPLTELVFRMSNKLKATYNSTYNSNDIKELNDILEAFNTNKNKEIFVHDLFKMVNKYFPNFNKEIFNNYFDNIKDEDLKDSADNLIRSFKSIINGISNFKQKLNEITNKYDEEYKLAKEKYFEDIKIYDSLTSVQKRNTPKPEFPKHKYVNYASYDLNSDIYKGIIEFSKQIINYTDSRARLNSTNAEGNSSSNVLKNCFITRFFEQINAETEIDSNAGLNNLKDYFTQGTKDGKENQYSHNSLLFGLTDENGFVQHEGLFRKTATGYEVTENAKKIISYSLFDGTKNARELKSANYSSMTKIDFFITQYIAFRDSVEEISENGKIKNIGKLDSAVYPMRIGADAPKIFFIRAPRYTKNQVQYSFYGHLMDEFNMFIKGINEIFIPENETVEDGQIVQIFKTRTDVHNLIGRAFFDEKIANKLKNEGKTDMTPAIVKDGELCGNLFSFKRLFKVNGYDVDSAIKTMLSLYGGVNKNGIITIDNDGRLRLNKNDIIIYNSQTKSFELNFNTEQKNQLKQIVREWTENFLFETNNSLSDFIKTLKENNIPFNLYTLESFLLNLANMNMNYDDLFEGDFKYYNNARDFLKRTKETQAGGEGYAGYDITEKFINNNLKELIWNNEPEVIQIDSDIVDKKGNITKQPITINNKTLIAKNGFRGITIYNTVKTSDYVDDMQKELERIFTEQGMDKEKAVKYSVQIAKGYGFAGGEKTKINDAQSYITFEEFIRRKWADGTINDYADLIKKLTDDTPIEELDLDKINTRIQIQKNFYYDKVYDETTGLFYPRQIKNAEFVLIPKLLPEGSELRKIHDWMQDNNIGQLNTAETSKAAKKNIFTIWDAETGKFNENFKDDFDESYIENYYYQYLYKQQDVPQHIMDEHNKAGVQIMKKIIDNIINEEELNLPDDENGNEHPLKTRRKRLIKLANDYQDAFTANIKEDFNNFLNAMDWIYNTNTGKIENLYYATKDAFGNPLPDDVIETNKTTLNFDNFYARAREEAARLGMDSNFMEYLIPNEFGNPNMPNYINIVTFKLESIAQSIYNNKITRQVLPGWHAAQITNVGYSTRLKFDPKTGVMEVLLPRWSNLIPKCKNKEEETELIQQMQTEGLDIHLGYRIPTEGKQSISILKVVGFVNDALGSTIVVPDEWVTQTGSDFDVDSVYGISWEMYVTKDKNNKISLHKIPYKENEINEKNLYIKYVNNILDYRLSKDENSSENDIDSFINLNSKIKSSVKDLKDDLNKIDERQELNESYNIINNKRDELFDKLPSWARGIIKIIDLNNRKTNQKENNVVDIRETFPIIQESLINYLNKHKINKEDSDIVKEYVDYVNAIIDILNQQDGLPAFDKEVYLSEKSNIIRELIQKAKDENFAKYEKQAIKYNLLSFEEWSKLPFVEKLDRKARNNFIIDTMIEIMSDETSKEEQYSRSHFENIINGENGANDIIDKISGKNNRNYSPYNPIDQLDYMEDSMEGAKLKALSVNWDTFISKNNKIRCTVEDTDAVQVVLNVDENAVNDSAINYNEDEIRNSYGDDITDYKIPKIDTDKEYSSSIEKLSVGTIKMEMDYGNEKRDGVKATNTFNAIKNGERTATTRYEKDGNLDYIKKFKVGDIIKIQRNNNYIYVKITKADYLPKNTSAEEWSKKEGWSVGHFYRKVQSEINKGEAYQLEFEYIKPENKINNIDENNAKLTVETLNSNNNELSDSEKEIITKKLGNKPRVLVASEATDPVFFSKMIKKKVENELSKPYSERTFHMMYLITKHDGLPFRELAELKIPKFIHFSITSLGGTKYEPGVMKMDDLLDRIESFIKEGVINPNLVTIRIDPIVPGVTKKEDIRHIIERSTSMGIRQFKFSLMDSYGKSENTKEDKYIIKRMREIGYEWEKYYDIQYDAKNNKNFISFNPKKEYIQDYYTYMDNIAEEFKISMITCGEQPKNLFLKRIRTNIGCINVQSMNKALGTTDIIYTRGRQRPECSCYGNKTDVFSYNDKCASSCVYCYATHNSNAYLKYYNEDGTLKDNAFTRTVKKDNIEGVGNNIYNYVLYTGSQDTGKFDENNKPIVKLTEGGDAVWGKVAKELGIKTVAYSPNTLKNLNTEQLKEVEKAYKQAVEDLQRTFFKANTYGGGLVRRDYLQAKAGDAVFAIGHIIYPGERNKQGYINHSKGPCVDGGTGYAVQMAINLGKPVHVFDYLKKQWYVYDVNQQDFVKESIPQLTPKFTGIGTRDIEGVKWIENVVKQVYLATRDGLTDNTEEIDSDDYKDELNTFTNNKRILFNARKIGFSSNNRNTVGQLVTTYASQTTAHHLDAVKMGSIPNVNLYTFSTYKYIASLGIDYETTISFIRQPIITNLVNNYNSSNSIFISNTNNPIKMTLVDIVKKLGIKDGKREITYNISNKRLLELLSNDYEFTFQLKKLFGIDISIMSIEEINDIKVPLDKERMFTRIRRDYNNKGSNVENLAFDFCMLFTFKNIRKSAEKINQIQQVLSSDNYGAENTLHKTRQIVKTVEKLRQENTLTRDGVNIIDLIFPLSENNDIDIDKSEYKSIAAIYKYATKQSLENNTKLFITENEEFDKAEEEVTKRIRHKFNESEYKEYKQYSMIYLYNQIQKLLSPISLDNKGNIIFNIDQIDLNNIELNSANQYWNKERSRIYGYGVNTDGDFEINNINKPTKDELNKFMNLTPAQKVLFMQKHFPDNQGIFNSIKITLLNNTDVKYKGINRQYLSFDDQIISIEDLLWLFSNSFSNKNKLIKLTCIDIIKYAFIAEGFAFRSGYVSKIIPNETLYTSINEGGLDIINEIKSKIEDLALQIQEDQFIDLYVRSHSNVIPIKRLSPLPEKEYVPEYNEYVYKKSNESTKFLEHIREDKLIHIDTTTNDKSIEYLCNSLNLFNLVGSYTRIYYPINEDTNEITLYKVIGYNEITNEIGDIIAYKDYYLMPLNLLDKYECYEYSYNQNYNIYNSPEYYISTINELNTKIKSYRDILTKYIGTKKYDTYNQQVNSIANKNTSAIYNPIGNYTTNNIDFSNQYTLMELYDRADDFTKGGVQKLINGIIGHIIDKEDNFSTPYVQFNPNISLSRLIPKESSVSQIIVLPNGTEIKVNIKHEKITSKFENNINDMLLGKKDKGIYEEAIQEMENTKTLIKNANLYTITKEKENPEVLKNNALKAATDLIIDEDNNFVKEEKSLPRRGSIDKVSSAIINEIHYEARKNQTPIAKSFVYELDKYHINRAMGSSLVENRGNIYKAASRYYRSAANTIINKLNNFQMKDKDGNPVVYSMDDPEMYEALAKNDEYFREIANIILQGITFGNRIIDILKLDISGEDKETKEAIEEIINNINSIKQNKKLLDAMNNLINIYFKKYSTNPEIIRDVLNLRESFGDLDQIDALIADPTDIDNNEVQVILKQVYSTIAKAEMFDAKRNVEEYKKELDKIKAIAGTIDMNNIIDSSRGMIRQFHNDQYLIDRQKVIDDLNIAYNNRNNSYEDYKKYIIAKYNRDKFMYDTTEQHILDEYYKKDLEIRKNAMDYAKDIYFKYLQLSQELHLEYPNETEEERDARKVKIISQMSQFRSEIDEIGGEKTEEEKAKVRALNKFLNERTELLEKYFESKEYDGFQENYKKYKDYIDKYNASHINETLQQKLEKDVNYREAYNWINTNGHIQFDKENSKKLKNAFKVLLSRKNVIKNTTIAKLKTVEGVIDINGRINPTKLTDEQIKLIRDEEIEDLNTIYDTSYSEITLINDVHVKVPLIRSYPKKENNDEKAYDEFKYSNNAEKIEIINKINNILSKCIDKDTGYMDYNVLFNNNYISDSEREELANLYDKLSALNRPIKNKYKKRKNQIFLEATDDIAFMNAMNFYKRIANSKQGKQFLQIFTKVNETGELVANPYIFGYLSPSDAEYVDHDKTNALRFIEDNVQFVTNEYYDIAKREAQEKGYEAYDKWFKLNHVYNPYKHAWVPLKIWTKLEAKPGSELAGSIRYVPNFNNLEKTVKSEYINNAENRKRVGLKGEGYKEFSNNYKIGNAKYDSNLNLNPKEKALRDLYVTTLNKYATTYKGKRFVGQGYLPRERKSIKNLQWSLGQIGSLLGISVHNNADSDSFHKEVDYTHDREAEMKMLALLEDKGTKKYIPLPIKGSMSDEEYAKEVNKVKEENRKISINNEKIDNALFNNNWEEVMEDFVHNATIFNARQATKPFLYLLLEDLNINNAYMIKGLWGKKLIKDSNVSTIDDTVYQTVKQTRTREIVHNLARRLLYEQYHERSVHRSVANFLQNLTSAKYMIFNLYGGIANIATGKVNISAEQYANEYFGFTEFAKAEKQYLSNSIQMLNCLYSDKAVNITTALIKKFNIVDIDQILQFNAGDEDLDKQLERVRNFLYSFQSIGEHYMQNSVLLAMLKSNRLYTDKDGVRRIGDFKTFSWDIERQAMEYVLKDNDILLANYKAFIDNMKYAVDIKYDISTGKKDINRMFLHSLRDHGETDIKNSYKKIATAYHKKRDDLMKDAKEEFLKNKTVEELFTFENGQAVIKKDILEEFNSKGKNPIGDLEYLISEFKEKVIRVNNKIHGVYNKNGAAQLEKKWYGSLIMQYHKHLYNGIFKRWRKKGFYSEFRGSKERGAYITLMNFLGTEFVNVKNDIKNLPQDGSNIVLHSIQVVMKATLNTFINISLNWNNLSNWERSNIKRILGDLSGALAAVLIVMALYSMYDEDEIKDDTFKASLLYLADRLYSDSTMFSPIGLVTEYKTAWSSPIASANGPSDLLKAMLLIPQALFDPDYNPEYQSGQYAGHNKLEILLRRNIPGIRPYDRIQFITKNNKYYKVGESQIGINIAKNFGETLND